MAFRSLQASIDTYVQDKSWYLYVPVWFFGLYIFIKLLSFELGGELPFVISIGQSFNFILHEIAHLLTVFLPSILTASAGSASELVLGIALIIGAFAGRTYFASLFCFLWFMLATQSIADYMADARAQNLSLVSFGGGDPIHDWNFIFGRLGLLEQADLIAGVFRGVGVSTGLLGLIFTAWLIYRMAIAKTTPVMSSDEAKLLHEEALVKGIRAAPPEHFKNVNGGNLYPIARTGPMADRSPLPTDKKK